MSRGKSNHDKFDRYVMNEIPIRLIRLSDMKFVERNHVRQHFRSSIPQGTETYLPEQHAKYAVLSHRWLDDGEPTYEEMKTGTATGPGYEKLKSFCEKAREYEMEFAWADTCCIDKSSSSELDESIRSMFRWYKNSAICIIHLAQSEIIEDMMGDEWYERGWTLQELLAPNTIKFFNMHWRSMTCHHNDKESPSPILEILTRETGIPCDVLECFTASPTSVDQRMAWAARRKTTRAEDLAYSLMGIFDVSLRIAYGEGGDRTFCRLIEAIMQAGDPSVLNWKGEPAGHRSSRAIPLSPESFLGSQHLEHKHGQLEMAMTSLGLRVSLVMLPLTCHVKYKDGYDGFTVFNRPLVLPIDTHIRCDPWCSEYVLGIVNYSLLGGSNDVLALRCKSAGVILSRVRGSRISKPRPARNDIVGLRCVRGPEKEFGRWTLENVGLVYVDFPNTAWESIVCIDHEYLQTVYL
ncbi:heterokaryon incompatibility protein-domain-containing protein [Suillus lakei]|nr:heterokaryon incompatibility protein-domain-containing protein [Suillus lakei]